jgi:hypothetical protein
MDDRQHPTQQHRIGFHYFPDTMHYRDSDLIRWLPEMQSLGAAWTTLYALDDHAIPEPFISGLVKANITPVVHLHSKISKPTKTASLKALLSAYASWGVRYITLFDRPNLLTNWLSTDWAQDKLVDRFLDLYLPYVEAALSSGLTPILPPLEPGGNYWDTAFLRDLLFAIKRRGYSSLLDHMVLSAYAKLGNLPINWGAGGPERWPSSKPYLTPKGSQNQCGFRIFDWYHAICNAVTGKSMPIILFEVGCKVGEVSDPQFPPVTLETHTSRHLEITKALTGNVSELEAIPQEVLACNFWPLCTAPGHPEASHAWLKGSGDRLPIVEAIKNLALSNSSINKISSSTSGHGRFNPHPIAHYLLLTEEVWEKMVKSSLILRNFMQKYQPTIGFSLSEAALAHRVTIFGSSQEIPEAVVDQLTKAGCLVERIQEDGTVIASKSSEA